MDFNFLNQKEPKGKGKKGKEAPNFSGNIIGAILIFMIITALYLVISSTSKVVPEVSISDLASSVQTGDVKSIVVEGEKLTITYKDNSIKTSKKETEASLSQTLFNYGVKPESLAATNIQVKDEGGFWYCTIHYHKRRS